jgi:ComF family protein
VLVLKLFKSLSNLIYTQDCQACGGFLEEGEDVLCTQCRLNLIAYQEHSAQQLGLPYGIVGFVSLMRFYKKGKVQQLIHRLKYRDQPEIGVQLGHWLGGSLKQSAFASELDGILSVPLHRKKEKLRGYNQSERIAYGISQVLEVPMETGILIKKANTTTQTQKTRLERMANVSAAFELLTPDRVKGKKLLLVDDVLTTGATMSACAEVLLAGGARSIVLATAAYAP